MMLIFLYRFTKRGSRLMQDNHPFHFFHFATRQTNIVRAILPRCDVDVEFARLRVGQLIIGDQLTQFVENINLNRVGFFEIVINGHFIAHGIWGDVPTKRRTECYSVHTRRIVSI